MRSPDEGLMMFQGGLIFTSLPGWCTTCQKGAWPTWSGEALRISWDEWFGEHCWIVFYCLWAGEICLFLFGFVTTPHGPYPPWTGFPCKHEKFVTDWRSSWQLHQSLSPDGLTAAWPKGACDLGWSLSMYMLRLKIERCLIFFVSICKVCSRK